MKTKQDRVREGKTKQDKARQDKAREGKSRQDKTRDGKRKQEKARQGKAKQGKAKQEKARQVNTGQDKTSQDKARQEKTPALTVSVQLQAIGQFNVGGDDGLAVGTVVVGLLYLGARTPVRPIDYAVEEGILAQRDFTEWLQSDT